MFANVVELLGQLGIMLVGIGIGCLTARAIPSFWTWRNRGARADSGPPPSYDEVAQLPLLLMKLGDQIDQRPAIQNQLAEIIRLAKLQASDIDRIVRDSRTDALTGLWNRRALDEQAPMQFSLAQRYGHPLAVAMLDIDHFKRLNDVYGHALGDAALRHVAQLLKTGLRDSDFVARYGGEEFAILLPETDLTGAVLAGERLRKSIVETPFQSGDQTVPVRVSMGVALARPEDAFRDVLERADAALLQAKQAGRNQVRAESGWSGNLSSSTEAAN